jgi:hypothetical protein
VISSASKYSLNDFRKLPQEEPGSVTSYTGGGNDGYGGGRRDYGRDRDRGYDRGRGDYRDRGWGGGGGGGGYGGGYDQRYDARYEDRGRYRDRYDDRRGGGGAYDARGYPDQGRYRLDQYRDSNWDILRVYPGNRVDCVVDCIFDSGVLVCG